MDGRPKWLDLAREIQALAQTGLTYTQNEFDTLRYTRLMEIAADIVASHSNLERESTLRGFSAQKGYATPKIDVRGAIVRDNRILLVQERVDGKWCMPGGWSDVGDLPSAMVEREVWEESGFRVKAQKVIAVYDANRVIPMELLELYHAYKIIFLCTIIAGEPRPSNETLAVDFFDLNRLPPLSSARTNERMLREVFAHVEDPGRVAAFD
jgi:ADP-ribose pyrophosphatase YjhB (NUDIX family)